MILKLRYRLFLKAIQIVNYGYYEITILDRLKLFKNHLFNSFLKNQNEVEIKTIKIRNTYVITLEERSDRRKILEEQIKNRDIKLEYFIVNPPTSIQVTNKYFHKNTIKCISYGAIGCAMSHINLLEKIARSENDDYFIVLEDDIQFSLNYEKIIHDLTLKYPVDSDLFYLGSRNKRKRDILFNTPNGYNRSFNNRLGAYGYLINRIGAKKILQYLLPLKLYCGGIDTALGMLIRKRIITAYQFNDCAVTHCGNNPSNIFNPSAPNKILHSSANSDWPLKKYNFN